MIKILRKIKFVGALVNTLLIKALLVVVYILGIGAVAIIARLVGKKFFDSDGWEPLRITSHERDMF